MVEPKRAYFSPTSIFEVGCPGLRARAREAARAGDCVTERLLTARELAELLHEVLGRAAIRSVFEQARAARAQA
jgi:hypothetical protein